MIKCDRCGGSVKSPKMMATHLESCPSPIPRYRKKNEPVSPPPPEPLRQKEVIPSAPPAIRKRTIKRR